MRKPTPGGRPSKGDRVVVASRMPRQLADEIKALSDDRDEYLSDLVATLVRIGLRHRNELPAPAQESLAIGA